MNINIAIVDDEAVWLDKIENEVRKNVADFTVDIDKYFNPEDLLNNDKKYDIIFLDIMLNTTKDGLDVAKQYKYINFDSFIILVSSLKEYLADGFKVDAFRFIVKDKPKEAEDYREAIEKIVNLMKSREQLVKFEIVRGGVVNIPVYNIKYIKNEDRNIEVHTIEDIFIAKGTVKKYEKILDTMNFVCTHESYLVNVEWIEDIKGEDVILKNNEKVALSRKQKKLVNEKMILHKARCRVKKW